MILVPLLESHEQWFDQFAIADEVVVREVDPTSIAQVIELLQFGKKLIWRFDTWSPAEQFDDVTELAVVRASSRGLHTDVQVVVEVDQVETRSRCGGHIRFVWRFKLALGVTVSPSVQPHRNGQFAFADNDSVRVLVDLWLAGWIRAADDNEFAFCVGSFNPLQDAGLLRQHASCADHISPLPIGFLDWTNVLVSDAEFPLLGKQCSDGHQS